MYRISELNTYYTQPLREKGHQTPAFSLFRGSWIPSRSHLSALVVGLVWWPLLLSFHQSWKGMLPKKTTPARTHLAYKLRCISYVASFTHESAAVIKHPITYAQHTAVCNEMAVQRAHTVGLANEDRCQFIQYNKDAPDISMAAAGQFVKSCIGLLTKKTTDNSRHRITSDWAQQQSTGCLSSSAGYPILSIQQQQENSWNPT